MERRIRHFCFYLFNTRSFLLLHSSLFQLCVVFLKPSCILEATKEFTGLWVKPAYSFMSEPILSLRQQGVNKWGITVPVEAIQLPHTRVPSPDLMSQQSGIGSEVAPSHFSMPPKSRKSRSHSSRPAKKTGAPKTPKKRSSSAKSTKTEVDILSPAAMENIYYISHNAVDCLEFRGFGRPHSNNKKKKGTKKKKKKKKS
ncbi:small lysine-rich protein 1 [Notolabrus celidotus]|uniref:small lysine-rich protein 1 n=1 Tax=Notolabrus celidotus TaxID=1203425 RepID=UPI0014903BD8|nr:small lysine-rich protein 1 [Notolabrus celidotus]